MTLATISCIALCSAALFGIMIPLPTLGGNNGFATMVNRHGQAVGMTENSTHDSSCAGKQVLQFKPAIWEYGRVTALPTLPGDSSGWAVFINDEGQVIGSSGDCGTGPPSRAAHALLWQNGAMTDLGTLPGDSYSWAIGINDDGKVVGSSCDVDFNCRAFLWQHRTMTDLNALLPPGSPLYLLYADDINDRGEIVGMAYDPGTGDTPAFLAVPSRQA